MVDLAKEEEQKLEEEIQKKIKTLPIEERVKAVSLNYFLRQKKNLDKQLEKELEVLNEKYDKLTLPLISQVLSKFYSIKPISHIPRKGRQE